MKLYVVVELCKDSFMQDFCGAFTDKAQAEKYCNTLNENLCWTYAIKEVQANQWLRLNQRGR